MPIIDHRTQLTTWAAPKGRRRTAGYFTVNYRDAQGRTFDALVVGPGTVSGLKLDLGAYNSTKIIDNVPVATNMKSTNSYFSRK